MHPVTVLCARIAQTELAAACYYTHLDPVATSGVRPVHGTVGLPLRRYLHTSATRHRTTFIYNLRKRLEI